MKKPTAQAPDAGPADTWLDQGIAVRREARRSRGYAIALTSGVLALAGWAGTAEVDKLVRAEGRIIPSLRTQVIQHLEGGIVAEVAVAEGRAVRQGQLLVSIDPTRADASLAERKAKRLALVARAARLTAEAEGQPRLVTGPELPADDSVVAAEMAAFASRRDKLLQEQRVLQEQIAQKRAELREQQTRQTSLGAEIRVARDQLSVVERMHSRQSASQMELYEAQARVQRYQTQIADAASSVPKLNAAISEIGERMRDATAKFRADARTELTQVRSDLDRVEQEIRGESDRVARTEIRAPVDGVINRVYTNTVGGVVKPGDTVIELTPSDGRVLIEARVRPADRADLRENLRAIVRLSAFDSARYGTLPGQLVEVSADTVPDEHGEQHYRVKVAVDPTGSPIPVDQMSAGMTATADVVTGRRTVLDYLSSPLTRFRQRAFTEPR